MVTTWSERLRFTRSSSEARVVDLPEPVGPVTSTSPLVSWQSAWTSGVMPISSTVGIADGITRKTAIGPPRSRAAFPRNRASPSIS